MADGQTLGPGIFEAGLLAALDSPQLVKFPAGYHEAYWFYGYDEHHSIGYYFYLVADTASDTLRHEQTYIFLADGSILADHGSGHGTTDGVARGDKLEFVCRQPFHRWQIRYDGILTQIPAQQRLSGVDGGPQRVAVCGDLHFTADTAAWNTEGNWGEPPPALRYHQLGRGLGTLTVDGRAIDIDSYCFRSHSRRQREMAGWAGHTLANAMFADGSAFGIFRMRGSEQRPERGRGFVIADGRLLDADVLHCPMLDTPSADGEHFTIELCGEFGKVTIHGEILTEVFLSQTPDERRYGVDYKAVAGMLLSDGFARFRWDNRETIGVFERSTLLGTLGE